MRLDRVMAVEEPAAASVEISALAYDSRRAVPGTLFFCVSGFERDGHEFAGQAVAAGAAALVVERPLGLGVPEVRVDSVRSAMGPAAARFWGEPTARLPVVGVTGTNGKTTTAFLVRALMEADGRQCGLLGTVKSVIAGQERPVVRTTPEALDLQADFAAMLEGGDRACVMEVSSHALALGRANGINFAAAVFTNLTQDHLDFHHTMEDYFLAKRRLFRPEAGPAPGVSVVNVGDPYGRRLAAELPDAITFTAEDADAHFRVRELVMGFSGCRLLLDTPQGSFPVTLPLPGRFNVANAVGALAAVQALGVDLEVAVAALQRGVAVPGRFEPIDEGQDFSVLVDYAHTPDSLENVLRAARELSAERVLCVFGAGGDRDRSKRPLMGEIAARLADVVLVTSDNPRSEPAETIIAEIVAGAARAPRPSRATALETIVDRRVAIERGVALARPGDVLVIAGKGHEQGQEFEGGRKLPFADAAVARDALRRLSAGAGASGAPR